MISYVPCNKAYYARLAYIYILTNFLFLSTAERIMRTQNYSRKRQAIYELLLSTDTHPSAEWIYNSLKPQYPDLSLGTVYRNLKLLEGNGAVRSVAVVDGCERYDAKMTRHSHFVCKKCGKITDVFFTETMPDLTEKVYIDAAKDVEEYNLIFYGICTEC